MGIVLRCGWSVIMQPGDCVMLNAGNSTVGQAVIQLCAALRLRTVAIVRDVEQTSRWLKDLGATVVLSDTANIRVILCQIHAASQGSDPLSRQTAHVLPQHLLQFVPIRFRL